MDILSCTKLIMYFNFNFTNLNFDFQKTTMDFAGARRNLCCRIKSLRDTREVGLNY